MATNEKNSSIEYSSESIIPEVEIDGILVHHERLLLSSFQEIVEKAGGKISGELHYV